MSTEKLFTDICCCHFLFLIVTTIKYDYYWRTSVYQAILVLISSGVPFLVLKHQNFENSIKFCASRYLGWGWNV